MHSLSSKRVKEPSENDSPLKSNRDSQYSRHDIQNLRSQLGKFISEEKEKLCFNPAQKVEQKIEEMEDEETMFNVDRAPSR